jgi:hypothetical protein
MSFITPPIGRHLAPLQRSAVVVIPIQVFGFGPEGRCLDVRKVEQDVTEEIQPSLRGCFAPSGNLPPIVEPQRAGLAPRERGHMFQASDPGDARLRRFEREFLARIAESSDERPIVEGPRHELRLVFGIPIDRFGADFADLGTVGSLP